MRRAVAAVTVIALMGLAAIAWPSPSSAATTDVSITDFQFTAATVTVQVGDSVQWTHNGAAPHSVTADDGSFDSSPGCTPTCMQPDDTFVQVFSTPGTFPYHCKIHGANGGQGMSGVVIVQGAGPTTTTQPVTTTTQAVTTTTAQVGTTTTTQVALQAVTPAPVAATPAYTG